MRADLAPFAVDLVLALAGLGVLLAIDIVPGRASSVAAAFGLAYMTGSAVVPLVLVALLTIGVPFTLTTFAVIVLLCIGAGALRSWKRPAAPSVPADAWWRPPWRSWPAEVWVVGGFVLVFGAFAAAGLVSAFRIPLTEWDAWSIWERKTEMLTDHDSLVTGFFAGKSYAYTHLDYPLQFPVWEALHFRAGGSFELLTPLRHVWLLLIGFVWAVAYLLRERVRPVVWAPLLLLVAAVPGVWQQLMTGYADVPMAMFVCLGAISLALWLSEGDGRPLALAAVMLAAGANTKNEGLMAAVALLLLAGLIGLTRGLRLRQFLLASGVVIVAVLPWRIWIAAHGIKGDLPVSKGLNPGYLVDQFDRVGPSIRALGNELANQGQWSYLLPLSALVVAASLISGIGRRVAAFYLASFGLVWAGLVWGYWVRKYPIDWYLATSVGRVVTVLMFICIAAVVHLSGLLLGALGQRHSRVRGDLAADPAATLEPVGSND